MGLAVLPRTLSNAAVSPTPTAPAGASTMSNLIAAALVFLGIHLFISGTRVRDAITTAIGERPYLGLFAAAERRFADAARHYRACLSGYAETGDAFLQSPLAGLARVAIEVGRAEAAAQLLGMVDAELERTGMRFDQFERLGYDQAKAGARAALGEEAFMGAYASGRTLKRDSWFGKADAIVAAVEAADASRQGRNSHTVAGLTPRERDILILVADGRSDREVAEALFIGQGTVRSHLTNIFGKLEVGSRTAAVAAARRLGIL